MSERTVIVFSPDNPDGSEMTERAAENYRAILEQQGKDTSQYRFVNKVEGVKPKVAQPKTIDQNIRIEFTPGLTLNDLNNLLKEINSKVDMLLSNSAKNKGGRPKTKVNAEVNS